MKKGLLTLLLLLPFFTILSAQSIDKKWILENAKEESGQVLTVGEKDYLELEKGLFSYSFYNQSEQLNGDYLTQNNVLLFFSGKAQDSIIKYKINKITDSTLVLSKHNVVLSFASKKDSKPVAVTETATDELIPNQGFSFNSLWRGHTFLVVIEKQLIGKLLG